MQALSLLLAMLLRNMVLPRRLDDESNEDIPVSRKPLLGPRPDAPTSIDRRISDDSLISRMRQKVSKFCFVSLIQPNYDLNFLQWQSCYVQMEIMIIIQNSFSDTAANLQFGFESSPISEDGGENRFPQLATMLRSQKMMLL